MTASTTTPLPGATNFGHFELPAHLRRPRLKRADAAEYLEKVHGYEIAVATLAGLAVKGGGPGFHRMGRVPLYPRDELDRWATERLGPLRFSTSER